MTLENVILELIESQKEGDHWDFKEKHHESIADLIKDIICLANNIRHQGERYIVFGVKDETHEIVGVPGQDSNKRKEEDIVQYLRQAPFAGGNYPEISLTSIILENKKLDVLIIEDVPRKPFYLEKKQVKKIMMNTKNEIKKRNKKEKIIINAGAIYSRVRGANTPSDTVASSNDIEGMWLQRFYPSLNNNYDSQNPSANENLFFQQSPSNLSEEVLQKMFAIKLEPFERLKKYLFDFSGWEKMDNDGLEWYYKQFPEFTIQKIDEEVTKIKFDECWVRAACNPEAYFYKFACKYHDTNLWSGEAMLYDEMRCLVPLPETKNINLELKLEEMNDLYSFTHFYTFALNNFIGILLQFFTRKTDFHIPMLSDRFGVENIPVIIFKSEQERKNFINYVSSNPQELSQIQYDESINSMQKRDIGEIISERDIQILKFCSRLANLYMEWRDTNNA